MQIINEDNKLTCTHASTSFATHCKKCEKEKKERFLITRIKPCSNHENNTPDKCQRCFERNLLFNISTNGDVLMSNQIGWGASDDDDDDDDPQPTSPEVHHSSGFDYDKLPENTGGFVLDIRQTKSFRGVHIASELTYRARIRNPNPNVLLIDMQLNVMHMFESLLSHLGAQYDSRDVVRIYVDHPLLNHAIIIPPTYLGYITAHSIWDEIAYVLSSASHIPADDGLDINVAIIRSIKGGVRVAITNVERDVIRKRSIIVIKNEKDFFCLPRAVVVAHSRVLWKNEKDKIRKTELEKHYKNMCDSRMKVQLIQAKKMVTACGVPTDRPGMLADISLYEDYLNMSITVISAMGGNQRVYNGSSLYTKKCGFLYHSDRGSKSIGHFNVIGSITGFMTSKHYCAPCHVPFDRKSDHTCELWCSVCERRNCPRGNCPILCDKCNRTCRSKDCFDQHQKRGIVQRGSYVGDTILSSCEKVWRCTECGSLIKIKHRDPLTHICGEILCNVCHEFFLGDDNHLCYMRSISSKSHVVQKFIFYDFECQQQDNVHTPNFVVAHTVCPACEDFPVTPTSKCDVCGDRCDLCSAFNRKENEYEHLPCDNGVCALREKIYSGPDTGEDFCKWLISDQHSNFTAIAHNARAYDAYFIYKYCINNGIVPEPIFNGSKIVYMHIGKGLNIRLLDSLNFLPMALAKLPTCFDLHELKKGYFPHFFNTPEHQNVILNHLPDMHHYDPDGMMVSKREDFLQWYEIHKNDVFDFQEEMLQYCRSDVDILLRACMKYRQLMMNITASGTEEIVDDETSEVQTVLSNPIDPFSFLTLPSVCLGVFRCKFIPETWYVLRQCDAQLDCAHEHQCTCTWTEGRKETGDSDIEIFTDNNKWESVNSLSIVRRKFISSPIGLIPPHGYGRRDNHSKESIQWLNIVQERFRDQGENIAIRHARCTDGEKTVVYTDGKGQLTRYKLDGYFVLQDGTKVACEFNGCHWHGCFKCFNQSRETTVLYGVSLAQRYRNTQLKLKRLRQLGYRVICKWSCDFQRDIQNSESLKTMLRDLPVADPMTIRDCYTGGRVGVCKMYHKCSPGERIGYCDFCSLYPSMLKQKKLPVGHPVNIVGNFANLESTTCSVGDKCIYKCDGTHIVIPYFGIMKIKVLPPRNLLHPVLPLRTNDKLKFPLCYSCALSEDIVRSCSCSESARSFVGTWCTQEVETAVNVGYVILETYEVLHWGESTVYDPLLNEGGLFTQYINTFLKLKQESNGLPGDVSTDEEIEAYTQRYYDHEHIRLDIDRIKKNEGLRQCAKLQLNTLYGKFGQKTHMKETKFVSDVGPLYNILSDRRKKVLDFHVMSDNMMQVEFEVDKLFQQLNLKTNVVLAAMCTSWARLELWTVMHTLGSRVLYHDTDSIIYLIKQGDQPLHTGDFLGDLTDELSCAKLKCKKETTCTGHWIDEFVSCGPKNYAYRLNTEEVCCKIRGFSLNHRGGLVLNFNTMKQALFEWHQKNVCGVEEEEEEKENQLVTLTTIICRDKYTANVYNRKVCKHYGVVYDKRRVLSDYHTLPFGYANEQQQQQQQ